MTIGASSLWLNNLKDIDRELMKCVARVWPTVIARLSHIEKEDKITRRLVNLLRKDRGVCDLGFLNIHYKLDEEDCFGDFTTKGILDMALFIGQDHDRYIAYECKRLNIVTAERKRIGSLAGAYVEEGVVRYATAKYSEKLPYGCMVGYVMDGDIEFSLQKLEAALIKRGELVNLESGKIDVKSLPFKTFETTHRRRGNNSQIIVRHRLLSMAN